MLGVGASRVYAGTVSVTSVWKKGDTLKADDINKNFADILAAINNLKHPDCPEDYTRDTTVTAFVLCKKGADEVVKVGTGGSVFWIDRYEASIWQNADGTGTQYGIKGSPPWPTTFVSNGEYTTPLYAVSAAGVAPSGEMTWFQAESACEANGKRLPTGPEWLRAARGTQDPGSSDGTGGACVTNAAGPRNTGGGTACVTAWGAQDMIGNVFEWTAEWYAGIGTSSTTAGSWPGSAFNSDATSNIASQAYTGNSAWQTGLPVAASRGGDWGYGTTAGRFNLDLSQAPVYADSGVGFRCVLTR